MKTLRTLEGREENASHTGGPLETGQARIARRNEAAKHDLKREQRPRYRDRRAKPAAERRLARGRMAPLFPRSCCGIRKPLLDHKERCREETPDHEMRGDRPCREQLEHRETAEHDLKGEKESSSGAPSCGQSPRLRGGEGGGREPQEEQRHNGTDHSMPVLERYPEIELRDERAKAQGPVRAGKARTVRTHQGTEHELPSGQSDERGVGVGEAGEKTRVARRRSLL